MLSIPQIITPILSKTKNKQDTIPFVILTSFSDIYIDLKNIFLQDMGIYAHSDMLAIDDLSDIWMSIKDSNNLAGKSHNIKIDNDQYISIDKEHIYRDLGVRQMISWLSISPSGDYKVLLIQNIDRLNTEGSNALLKSLEEPPSRTLIIATTNNTDQLLPTVISRSALFHIGDKNPKSEHDDIYDQLSHIYMQDSLTIYHTLLSLSKQHNISSLLSKLTDIYISQTIDMSYIDRYIYCRKLTNANMSNENIIMNRLLWDDR